MSATYSETEKKFLKTFLNVGEPEPFLTMYQLSSDNTSAEHYLIQYYAAGSQKEILDRVNKDLHYQIVSQKKPVILFVDDYYASQACKDALSEVPNQASLYCLELNTYQEVADNKKHF